MNNSIQLRPATAADQPFMYDLFAGVCEHELGLAGWLDPQKDALIAMQFEAQCRAYRESYPDSVYQIVEAQGRPIGRMLVHRGADAIRIVDIALLPEHRNHGIGGALVKRVLDEAAREQKHVRLSVRPANPAQRLYRRLGFTVVDRAALHDEWKWSGPSD